MPIRVLAFVLAGGKGTRLYPLTKERAKPAVPFGGRYRIVDFVLSNLLNSGIYSIYVLIQFKSQSLLQHISEGWEAGGLLKNNFIIPVPAQMRSPAEDWYRGTADAIYQNINLIEQANPDIVVIFGADHIYRMNIRQMIEYHVAKQAEVTIAAIPVPRAESREFGVIEAHADGSVAGFHEKKANAPTMPGNPERVFASMGNYIFNTDLLLKQLHADGPREDSSHDFGHDILPGLINDSRMFAYDFQTNEIPGDPPDQPAYWRDVGTIDAYYEASMDLRSVKPELNLYNRKWPLRTAGYQDPPVKFTSTKRTAAAPPWIPSSPEGRYWQAELSAIVSSAEEFGYTLAQWSKIPFCSTTATSAGTQRSGEPSWTKMSRSPTTPPSVMIATRTASIITLPRAASWSWKGAAQKSS